MESTNLDKVDKAKANIWIQVFANVAIIFVLWPLILAALVVGAVTQR